MFYVSYGIHSGNIFFCLYNVLHSLYFFIFLLWYVHPSTSFYTKMYNVIVMMCNAMDRMYNVMLRCTMLRLGCKMLLVRST